MKNRWIVFAALLSLFGCRTFVAPFAAMRPDYDEVPTEPLRAVALDIEKAVRAGDRTPDIEDRGGIVVNTDEVLQAIRTRAARAELVNRFRETGHACEHRDGLLWIIRSAEYKKSGNRRKRDLDARLVIWENEDRRAIYTGILKASGLPRTARGAVQEIFHGARVQCLPPGQKYENEAGDVVRKTSPANPMSGVPNEPVGNDAI